MNGGVSTEIEIGGTLAEHDVGRLADLVAAEHAAPDWTSPGFADARAAAAHIRRVAEQGRSLVLVTDQLTGRNFSGVKSLLEREGVPFRQYYDPCGRIPAILDVYRPDLGFAEMDSFRANTVGDLFISCDDVVAALDDPHGRAQLRRRLAQLEAFPALAIAEDAVSPG